VKQKKVRNLILQLKTKEGVSVEDQGTIENLLVDHFKKSYEGTITTSSEYMLDEIQALPIPQLSSQQNLTLNYPITNWEIESTIFQLGSHKAPELNGIPTFFYQDYWETIKNYISTLFMLSCIQNLYSNPLTIPLSP